MKWLSRFRLSRQEASALLAVCGLYAVGLSWKHVQKSPPRFDAAYYARLDSLSGAGALTPSTYRLEAHSDTVPKPRRDSLRPPASETALDGKKLETGRLNVNEATHRQLTLLPGIGPSLAQRIIDYRERAGPFSKPSDLLNVKGIGTKKLERFEGLIVAE